MTTIAELGAFLAREAAAANPSTPLLAAGTSVTPPVTNGTPVPLAKST
jgi:hypothetical protein